MLAGALCAVTTTLKFNFFVLKLPIRPPALVAKQAGSLAAMFDNRLGLGVGTSPWPEDYELMGVPFAKRGKRMDECIEIIKGLTSGEYFEFHGEFYDIPKTKMTPAPTQADPDPRRRPRRGGAAARRALRRLDARRRQAPRNSTDCINAAQRDSRRRGAAPDRSRSTSSRSTHTPSTASSGSRTRASPTPSSASGCPTSWARTPNRSMRRSATWRSSPRR